jgi:hypothetical protein
LAKSDAAETIVDVHWEGPFEWANASKFAKPQHVLYALYGAHHAYGLNVLLYIGRTGIGVANRFAGHEAWVADEYDPMTVRVASLGQVDTWRGWDEHNDYPIAPDDLVRRVESLLIFALQPAYNRANKDSLGDSKGLRIFNTGRIGTMLPEVSHRYHDDEW